MLSEENSLVLYYYGGTFFVFVLVTFLLVYVYLHQRKVGKFKLQLKKQEELFIALHEGEEKERKRLAEELHDGIGTKLSSLKMSMEYLGNYYLHKDSETNLNKGNIAAEHSGLFEKI